MAAGPRNSRSRFLSHVGAMLRGHAVHRSFCIALRCAALCVGPALASGSGHAGGEQAPASRQERLTSAELLVADADALGVRPAAAFATDGTIVVDMGLDIPDAALRRRRTRQWTATARCAAHGARYLRQHLLSRSHCAGAGDHHSPHAAGGRSRAWRTAGRGCCSRTSSTKEANAEFRLPRQAIGMTMIVMLPRSGAR